MKMKKLYVIGDPIEHSFSPIIHNAAFKKLGLNNKFTYDRMKLQKEELEGFLEKVRAGDIAGASVTMPHKEAIIPLLDELTKEAELIRAVNTVYTKNGTIIDTS